MNILVLNAGSSSQKSCLYRLPDTGELPHDPLRPVWEQQTDAGDAAGRVNALRATIGGLWGGPGAVLGGPDDIDAVGHRVVHGGAHFRETVRITPLVTQAISDLCDLAPTHNPAALDGIAATTALLGEAIPQFAVFDTAFHRTLPDAASVYPGPYAWVEQNIRRYGFHGINHGYIAARAARLLDHDSTTAPLRLISCHLGNGCSLAAIRDGVSIDTTMGFTPMDGLMMGSRSGSVDPGILLYLLRKPGATVADLDHVLNQESGLKGISGISSDMREVTAAIAAGDPRASLAFDIYVHRIRTGIGAMLASLGGSDALIFTAGVGEHSAAVRAAVCDGFGFIGLTIDAVKNEASAYDQDIAPADSRVRVLIIRAEEDWAIAGECRRLMEVVPARVRRKLYIPRLQDSADSGQRLLPEPVDLQP